MRLEQKSSFTISGYLIETLTTEASYDVKSAELRDKHEASLRKHETTLYGATWFTNDEKLYYLFGVEAGSQNHVGSDSVQIPGGLFAVATVPSEMPLIHAWVKTWEANGLSSIGYDYIEGEKCFELFGEDGVREIWVPVVKNEGV